MKTFFLLIKRICAVAAIFFGCYFPVTAYVVFETISDPTAEFNEYVNIMFICLALFLISFLGYLIFSMKSKELENVKSLGSQINVVSATILMVISLLIGILGTKWISKNFTVSESAQFHAQMREAGYADYNNRLKMSSELRYLLLIHNYTDVAKLLSRCSETKLYSKDVSRYFRILWYSVGTAPKTLLFPAEIPLRADPPLANDTLSVTMKYDRETSGLIDIGRVASFIKATNLSDDEKTTLMLTLSLYDLQSPP